jgi:serine/threonine protein kinase
MWSAGVCLFAMIVGSVPFKASTMSQLNAKIKAGKYEYEYQAGSQKKGSNNLADTLSESIKDLISKLLKVDPQERLSAEEALQHAWFKDAPT